MSFGPAATAVEAERRKPMRTSTALVSTRTARNDESPRRSRTGSVEEPSVSIEEATVRVPEGAVSVEERTVSIHPPAASVHHRQ